MNKFLKLAVVLTAVDNMTAVIQGAAANSRKAFDTMGATVKGAALIQASKAGFEAMQSTVKASADLEEAGNKLKAVMMGKDGMYNPATYQKIEDMSQKLSEIYAGSATSYIDMARVMRANRINEKDILGGVGEATAKLADYFDQMHPAAIGEFAARMKNDFGITVKEMPKMMDYLARMKDAGVGKTGEEAVQSMNYFFSKASLGLANLRTMGLQASKELGAAGGYFISRGLSAETVGNNFRRMMDTIRDPKRMAQLNDAAKKAGVSLEIMNNGKFVGWGKFIQELGKLKGLDVDKIAGIVSKPFGGKQGLSTDFIEFLANEGTEKYAEFLHDMERQATLDQKLTQIMHGLNYEQKVFKTSWENVKATFGNGLLPLITDFFLFLNKGAVALRNFMREYPGLTKFVAIAVSIGIVLSMLKGVWLLFRSYLVLTGVLKFLIPYLISFSSILNLSVLPSIGAFIKSVWALSAAFFATPVGWVVLGLLAVAAALVYCYFKFDKFRAIVNGSAAVAWHYLKIVWLLHKALFNLLTLDFKGLKNNWAEFKALSNQNLAEIYQKAYDNTLKVKALQNGIGGVESTLNMNGGKSPIVPISKPKTEQTQNFFSPSVTVYADNKTDGKAIADDFEKRMQKMFKEWQHNQQRLSFRP